jgi:Protein of unknown function (DUF3089)
MSVLTTFRLPSFASAAMSMLLFASCAQKSFQPTTAFSQNPRPKAPDYHNSDAWAALPDRKDAADITPPNVQDEQETAKADVFFLYPTVYTGKDASQTGWNAPINDPAFNKLVDEGTIQHQASIFNGAGRIFAPRYRQAHLSAYFSKEKKSASDAFALAYQDIKTAFELYLSKHNDGRPIIIASHSQGTTHATQLLKEFFDGKPLQKQLVAAYIVGIAIRKDEFTNLQPCEKPDDTGCFCTWRTWERDNEPEEKFKKGTIVVTNPIIWNTKNIYASRFYNEGAILQDMNKIHPQLVDAQPHNNVLWVNKPVFPGSFLIVTKNFHAGDFNLFYMNVRNNAKMRVDAFVENEKKSDAIINKNVTLNAAPMVAPLMPMTEEVKEKDQFQAKGIEVGKKKDDK